jgi:hypothetical protein
MVPTQQQKNSIGKKEIQMESFLNKARNTVSNVKKIDRKDSNILNISKNVYPPHSRLSMAVKVLDKHEPHKFKDEKLQLDIDKFEVYNLRNEVDNSEENISDLSSLKSANFSKIRKSYVKFMKNQENSNQIIMPSYDEVKVINIQSIVEDDKPVNQIYGVSDKMQKLNRLSNLIHKNEESQPMIMSELQSEPVNPKDPKILKYSKNPSVENGPKKILKSQPHASRKTQDYMTPQIEELVDTSVKSVEKEEAKDSHHSECCVPENRCLIF